MDVRSRLGLRIKPEWASGRNRLKADFRLSLFRISDERVREMSEAELIESTMLVSDAVFESVSLYLTCVTAYLVAAYSIGAKLSRFQVAVISVLFTVFAAPFVMSIHTSLWNVDFLSKQIAQIRPDWVGSTSPEFIWGLLFLDSAGIVTCLAFMWNIRHSKAE